MRISEVKKYKHNGHIYVGGKVPFGAEIVDSMIILNATDGFILIRKSDNEDIGSSVWLKDGDNQDNYYEQDGVKE